jgi:hypothetical protein
VSVRVSERERVCAVMCVLTRALARTLLARVDAREPEFVMQFSMHCVLGFALSGLR